MVPADFFNLIWKGIWSAACELSPFGVRIETCETEGHDAVAGRRMLERLLKSPPDALAIIPAHVDDLNEEIGRIALAGVPVVTFNADAPRSRRNAYVGTDPLQSGALAGELLGKLMQGRGTFASFPGALFPGSFETEHMSRRYQSFRQEMATKFPGVTEAVCPGGAAGVQESARKILKERPDIGGFYVGDSQVHLVAEVMEQMGIRLPCVGFDHTQSVQPFLSRGSVSAVIDENPYQQGYLAIQKAFELILNMQTKPYSWFRIPSGVVLSASSAGTEASENRNAGEVEHCAELMVKRRTQLARSYQEQLEDAEARIAAMEETDPLTGLLNRRRFEAILEKHACNGLPLTLLMAGLNGFRRASGSPGSHVRDEALTCVATALTTHARPQDFCSRLSSDEFCVLLPGDSRAQALAMKERILMTLAGTAIAPRTLNLGIQVKIGIASMPLEAVNAEDLLVLADNAMYADQRVAAIRELSPVSNMAN